MIAAVLACVVGLGLLAWAADQFVIGAARLATLWRISPLVIGAVLVGFGTSAPELLVSGLAASRGDADLGVGNIVGSNVANLTLVMGLAALLVPLSISSTVLRREVPLSLGAAVLFAVLVWDGLTVPEGVVLLVALAGALGWLLHHGRRDANDELLAEVEEFLHPDRAPRMWVESLRTLAGLALTVLGAQLLVGGATEIADELELSRGFVGLTLVAIGTSLPEVVTALAAARRREAELVVGNLLGSNLFNSLAVGGAVALLGPAQLVDPDVMRRSVLMMIGFMVLVAFLVVTHRRVGRIEAMTMLGLYGVSLVLLAR
jgi:cation:H+ antiporter